MLPVINVDIKYNMPAHYDDMLTVRAQLLELPGVMITFNYDVLRGEEILCTGKVRLAFMHSDTKKACRPPKKLIDLLKKCGDF
ncbi:MAG: hotdog domain-containing protein, partial [Rikenellaceae bacterium]